jgi:hypothetical protein
MGISFRHIVPKKCSRGKPLLCPLYTPRPTRSSDEFSRITHAT